MSTYIYFYTCMCTHIHIHMLSMYMYDGMLLNWMFSLVAIKLQQFARSILSSTPAVAQMIVNVWRSSFLRQTVPEQSLHQNS